MLNNNYKIDKITYPYTVWTIDNFLSEEIIKKMSDNWYGPKNVNYENMFCYNSLLQYR